MQSLSCCTAALYICCKLAGEKLYGKPEISHGALEGKRVFCSDMTFDATLNPIVDGTEPNYWLSALIIDEDYMCKQVRDDSTACYIKESGKSCPTEILEKIIAINAEGRPIWKPMHMQPMYRMHECVAREGSIRCRTNAYISGGSVDVGADIFARGLCLPSDNKMTPEQQDVNN